MLGNYSDFESTSSMNLQMLYAAYLKETDIKPEDCELVVEISPTGERFWFRKREKPEKSEEEIFNSVLQKTLAAFGEKNVDENLMGFLRVLVKEYHFEMIK